MAEQKTLYDDMKVSNNWNLILPWRKRKKRNRAFTTKGKKEKLGVYDEREKSEMATLPLNYQILEGYMKQKSFASHSIIYP